MTEADLDRLRAVLTDMRDQLVARLADRIEGGALALLSSVGGALAAVQAIKDEEE